jgi:hypothetical protein
MRFRVVCNLVTHTWRKREFATVFELGMQRPFDAEKYVPFLAPVVGGVAGRVLDHSNADVPEVLRVPIRNATFAFMLRSFDTRSVGGAERDT